MKCSTKKEVIDKIEDVAKYPQEAAAAKKVVEEVMKLDTLYVGKDAVAKMLGRVLDGVGYINGFKIVNETRNIHTDVENKVVYIPVNKLRQVVGSGKESAQKEVLKAVTVHELVHVLQAVNGDTESKSVSELEKDAHSLEWGVLKEAGFDFAEGKELMFGEESDEGYYEFSQNELENSKPTAVKLPEKKKNISMLGLLDAATLKGVSGSFRLLAVTLEPVLSKVHKYSYLNYSTYRGMTDLLMEGVWNSDFASKLKVSLGVDGTVPDKVLRSLLQIGSDISQKSYEILSEDIPKLRAGINSVYNSTSEHILVHKTFGSTGIINVMINEDAEKKLLGKDSIDDILGTYVMKEKQRVLAEELAELYVHGRVGSYGYTNADHMLFRKDGISREAFNEYVAFLSLSKIPGGIELVRDLHHKDKKLYASIKQALLQVKGSSEVVNRGTDDYEGNMLLDITSKAYEYKLVKPGINGEIAIDSSVWRKLGKVSEHGFDLYVRELDSGFTTKGVGISKDRFVNGQRLSAKFVEEQLDNDPEFLSKNNISRTVIDGKVKYRLHIPTKIKEEQLALVQDLSEGIFRTLVNNKELIETEKLKDIIRRKATTVVTKDNIDELVLNIRRKKTNRPTVGPIPMFLKYDKASLGRDFVLPKELKEMYAAPKGKVSTFNKFDETFDVVRKDMQHILLDSSPNNIFKAGTTARKVENVYRHLVSWLKIRLIASPQKLLGDAAANSALLVDVPMESIKKYGSEYASGMDELGKLRNEQIRLELKELEKPGKYKKQLKGISIKIERAKMYPALKHGFLQSVSTGMVMKDFESIRGLQEDIDTMLDKLLNSSETERTNVGKVVEMLMMRGFEGEKVLKVLSKVSSKASSTVGNEFEAMAKRLKSMKSDQDVIRYVGELIGSPSSEMTRQSSNIMVNIDGISRWIYYNYLLDSGMDEDAAAKETLERFVDYRVNLPEEVKLLSDLGFVLFPSFWMKYQKVLYTLIKRNPASSAAGYTMDSLLGVGGAHPLDSNIVNKFAEGTVFGTVDPLDSKIYNPYWWLF